MDGRYGTLYMIPCPISDETEPWDVLPAANRAVMDGLDYFIVENDKLFAQLLETLAPATRLMVAVDITAPGERILTRTVEEWRRSGRPELNKRPALFAIGM